MNITIQIIAWLAFALAVMTVFYWPSRIGKPKEGLYTGGGYTTVLVECFIVILLAGRCLRWW